MEGIMTGDEANSCTVMSDLSGLIKAEGQMKCVPSIF
jgi:hypothetical protein